MIINAKLLAVREGSYTVYVFQNLDSKSYIMCTKLPNWQTPSIQVGDEGFLKYSEVRAGEKYFHTASQSEVTYNYSNIYFENFIQKSDIVNENIIL